jgi:hypothetical protein
MYFPNQNTTQVYSPFGTYVVEQHDKGSGKDRRFDVPEPRDLPSTPVKDTAKAA